MSQDPKAFEFFSHKFPQNTVFMHWAGMRIRR